MTFVTIEHEGRRYRVVVARTPQGAWVGWPGGAALIPRQERGQRTPSAEGDTLVRAPMTGRVVKLAVRAGDTVQRGDLVAVLEAMKMEYRLTAPRDGLVHAVGTTEGALVDMGAMLVEMAP